MSKTTWGIALALAIFAAAWVYRGDSDVAPEKRAMMERGVAHDARGQSAETVLSIKPGAPMRGSVPEAVKLTPLLKEYLESKNFRELFDRVKNAPQRTGEESWLLARLLENCARVTDRKPPPGAPGSFMNPVNLPADEAKARFIASISDKDPNRDKRIAAYDWVNLDRCGPIRNVATTTTEIEALRQAAASAGDPKARIWSARELPARTRFDVIKEVMSSGDPIAMETAGFYLAFMSSEDFSLRAGSQQVPVDSEAFSSAARLLACDFGRPCGSDSQDMAWSCASRGQCDARTLREFLFFYQSSPSQSQLIAEYHHALTRAAREGDWSYFTVHNGPAPQAAMFGPPPPPKPPAVR